MAPFRQVRSREPTSRTARYLRTPQAKDAQFGCWERQELEQMDARFRERMAAELQRSAAHKPAGKAQ